MNFRAIFKRGTHRGACTADFRPFIDAECYECMFYVDDDCPYLIRGSEQKVNENV